LYPHLVHNINNIACADDIALVSENPDQAQALINMAYDYAYMEGYELQPTKSVVLNISQKQNNSVLTCSSLIKVQCLSSIPARKALLSM
jgi:hypothetical protein